MSFNEQHRQEQNRRIKSHAKNKTSMMNNSKWRKLFFAVSDVLKTDKPWGEPGLKKCSYKLLKDSVIKEVCWPSNQDILEAYIRDGVWGCPVEYKDIEWVSIPATYELNQNAKAIQNIKEVYSAIESLGKFEIKITGDEMVVYGYQ